MPVGISRRDVELSTQLHLPHGPGAANAARRRMAEELRGADLPRASVTDAEIVIGELVANAHEHGRPGRDGSIEVGWWVHDRVIRISVRDGGEVDSLAAGTLEPTSHRGRGLAMVDVISERWSVEHEHPGTRVTAEIRY